MSDEMTPEEITQQLLDAVAAIDAMQAQLDDAERAQREPLAIVGVACRFPGANTPEQFWQLLREGRDAVTDVPPDRWDAQAYYDADRSVPGKMVSRRGAFVEGIDEFDAEFFDLLPREAALLDPQQRILLQTAWEALEDASIAPDRLAGSKTGVFVGACTMDYALLQFRDHRQIAASSSVGCSPSILANRLSYTLDLKGPSVTVDTACSSSLVALHQAAASLRTGECDLVIVGGVNAVLAPEFGLSFSKLGLLSPDGRCRTFDAQANGYVRGEGCGVVVLKRLSAAVANGDRIWAVLRGSAVNQDGRTNGITAPNGAAQVAVMRDALSRAGVEPTEVTYIEAHGIGTAIGDAIEVDAISEVYGARPEGAPTCLLGSVKPNIGHLEGAAGIAALIKTTLCLTERQIPPVAHFRALNPEITLDDRQLAIPTSAVSWPAVATPRRAAVSAFGFGGTNAHAILEEPPASPVRDEAAVDGRVYALPLSARSPEALRALADRYRERLLADDAPSLADACFTVAAGRAQHDHREVAIGRSRAELVAALETLRARPADVGAIVARPAGAGRLAFVCSGTTSGEAPSQEASRTAGLQGTLEACDAIWKPLAGWSLLEPATARARDELAIVQLFAQQVARAQRLRACGVRPDAVIGRGIGEIAAAHIAGMLTLEDSLMLLHAHAAGKRDRLPEHAVRVRSAAVPVVSMTRGTSIHDAQIDPRHLGAGGPEAVARAIDWMIEHHVGTIVELVADAACAAEIAGALSARGQASRWLPAARTGATDEVVLVEVLAALYRGGRTIDWTAVAGAGARRTRMPTYPWQGTRLWFGPQARAATSRPRGTRTDRFAARPFRLTSTRPGMLDGLKVVEVAPERPGPGEVRIAVQAASLNFRDVLRALGAYPGGGPAASALGDECAGHVVEVGEGVADLAPGDDVIAIARNCFGSHVLASQALAWRAPAGWSAAEAASIPIVFGTAYHALQGLARLQRGERVLIHSATGGVGLAAIQIARWLGAEVFATAGSPAKRALLESMGIEHVMDSRSLEFADEVMRRTRGEGVDVVLNSLAGEALVRSLSLLRSDGRFIEIGKRDIHANLSLGLEPFRRRLMLCHLDLGSMIDERPGTVSSIVREVLGHIDAGAFKPLPTRVMPLRAASQVFVDMAQARHTGKLVFSIDDTSLDSVGPSIAEEPLPRIERLAPQLRGGAIQELLVDHLATSLRIDRAALDAGASLRDLGMDSLMTLALCTSLQQRLGVSLSVVTLSGLPSVAKIAEYVASKLDGSTAEAIAAEPSTCSTSCDVRSEPEPGPGLRAELLALESSARQPWLERTLREHVARVLRLEPSAVDGRASLRDLGMDSLMTLELRTVLQQRLGVTLSVVKLAALPNLSKVAEYALVKIEDPTAAGSEPAPRDELLRLVPERRLAWLESFLTDYLSRRLEVDPRTLDPRISLRDLGLDSLMTLELRTTLHQRLGIAVSVVKLAALPSLRSIAEYAVAKLETDSPEPA